MADPTEEMVKREVSEARRILREDKLLKSHGELRERFDKHFPEAPEENPNGPPKPPPPIPPTETPKRKGLWWGEEKEQ